MRSRAAALLLLPALVLGCYRSYPRIALDEDADEDVCVPEPFEAVRVDPGVLILLDRSRSMWYPDCEDPPPEWDYWNPAVAGINSIVGGLERSVAFGLGLFPDPASDGEPTNCFTMETPANPVRLVNASAIEATLSSAGCPNGGTPTAPSIESAGAALGTYVALGTASVLLVTDGAPNCNFDLVPGMCTCTSPDGTGCDFAYNCLDDVRTYAALDALRLEKGVMTTVIGLVGASGRDWTHVMHTMAEHGGTGEAVLVEDPDDVAPVIEELTRQIVPCVFHADPDDLLEPDTIIFEVAGEPWPRDVARLSGWDLEGPGIVRFYGAPCDLILGDVVTTVTGVIPCGS